MSEANEVLLYIIIRIASGRDHPQDKAEEESTADEYDQIGRKECHDKPEWII